MTHYAVKRINLNNVKTTEDYWRAINNAPIHYCKGIAELREYCGGSLHRQRKGYSGINGSIEYVAERC